MVRGYDSKELLCIIPDAKPSNSTSLEYLNLHKDELFECFIKEQVKILENSLTNLTISVISILGVAIALMINNKKIKED